MVDISVTEELRAVRSDVSDLQDDVLEEFFPYFQIAVLNVSITPEMNSERIESDVRKCRC